MSYDDGFNSETSQQIDSLSDAVAALADGGPHNPDIDFNVVGDFWRLFMSVASEFFDHSETYLEADEELTQAFLNTPIDEIATDDFEENFADQITAVLDAVNDVYPMAGISVPRRSD